MIETCVTNIFKLVIRAWLYNNEKKKHVTKTVVCNT